MTHDIQLSKHFRLSEFLRSDTATRLGIDNTPSLKVVSNLQYLCTHCLEPLRERFNKPLRITSGYRCKALNDRVSRAPNSNHLYGYAADIHVPNNREGREWFLWMMDNLQFDELITERKTASSPTFWIHIAIKQEGGNRQYVKEGRVEQRSN